MPENAHSINSFGVFMKLFLLVFVFFFSFVFGETEKVRLYEFKKNIYSLNGEDGIIEKIFDVIGVNSKRCIEFGAWDGFHLSNTANLFVNKEWEAILIECDRNRFNDLIKNISDYKCNCICDMVGIQNQSIEAILERHNISCEEIDLLSIDIDGNDIYVFQTLEQMKPRVVVCEYNPTIPAHLDVYSAYGSQNYFGCSVGALIRVGREKGYSLAALTECNAIFVRNDEIKKLSIFETDLNKISINTYIRYMITDFSGKFALIGNESFKEPYGVKGQINVPIYGNIKKIIY
jgi:hypothetical protein